MEFLIHQAGIILLAAQEAVAQPEPSIADQVGQLMVGAIPTALLFILLVLSYQFLVQRPLSRTLDERRARTDGAVEAARQAIGRAEEKAREYETKLRQARVEVYKVREERLRQWNAERDAALDGTRKAAGAKVSEARVQLDAEAAQARQTIQASAGELASRIVRAVLPLAAGGTR
ncbi:MAG TPA: ATP synthase F0 subunit B [Terracidiphilus sp.]|jgi:F-type H+-transporting ATPase subunit b|nr:ATP synthase F0 subunit B [Terracidiphilus sp.]